MVPVLARWPWLVEFFWIPWGWLGGWLVEVLVIYLDLGGRLEKFVDTGSAVPIFLSFSGLAAFLGGEEPPGADLLPEHRTPRPPAALRPAASRAEVSPPRRDRSPGGAGSEGLKMVLNQISEFLLTGTV